MRLLLVDPDGVNRYTISKTLQRAGYVVADVDSGEVALERYNKSDYDLILAEIDLPGISGLELLREIKQSDPDAIVILVTERADLDDAVQALRLGAKDYLVKPYSSEEIRASVESGIEQARMLRRRRRLLDTIERNVFELAREVSASGQETVETIEADSAAQRDLVSPRGSAITLGPLSVMPGKYEIAADKRSAALTPTEFDILLYLAAHRSRVVSCQELVREVRGYRSDETEAREVIRPHISNLRRKLKGLGEFNLIVNVRGVGYRLVEFDESD